jgi:nuclear pore complex protein Nup98-Nup96
VVRGVAAAVSARDPRMATLLAQSNLGGKGGALAAAQLQLWRGSPAEKYLSAESQLVFGLLAGEVAPPPEDVNVGGWRQNFGLHLWYSHAPTATLARAVEGYLTSVQAGTAVFPAAPGSSAVDNNVSRLKDISFNLLALASAGAVPPDVDVAAVFHPLTYCAGDLTNAALAWHLFVALRAVVGGCTC